MDMFDPSLLMSGMLISTIGLGMFVYGRRCERFRNILFGIALMALPVVVHSLLWMWLGAAACVAGSVFLPEA